MASDLLTEFKSSPSKTYFHGSEPEADGGISLEKIGRGASRALRNTGLWIGTIISVIGSNCYTLTANPVAITVTGFFGMGFGQAAAISFIDKGIVTALAGSLGGMVAAPLVAAAVPLAVSAVGAGVIAVSGLRKDDLGAEASRLLKEMGEIKDGVSLVSEGIEKWRSRMAEANDVPASVPKV